MSERVCMSKIVLAPTPRAPGSRQLSARPSRIIGSAASGAGTRALRGLVMSETVLVAKRQGGGLGRSDALRPVVPPAIVPFDGAARFFLGHTELPGDQHDIGHEQRADEHHLAEQSSTCRSQTRAPINRLQRRVADGQAVTMLRSGSPRRQRSRLAMKNRAWRSSQSSTRSLICGVIKTLGRTQSGFVDGKGSVANTSR